MCKSLMKTVAATAIAAALSVPVAGLVAMRADGGPVDRALMAFLILMAAFVVWAHRSNIRRLLAGEEPSIREAREADGGGGGA